MKISINREFEKLIDPLSREEFSQLKENIISDGIRDPLVIWRGFMVYGHNRHKIALVNNLPFTTVELKKDTEEQVKEWIILNQFGRRNISTYQRGVLALELKDLFAEKAAMNKVLAGENHGRGQDSFRQNCPKLNTRKSLSELSGLGERTISMVDKIQQKATTELKEKVSSGELSVNQAYNEIRKEERKQDIAEQKEDISTGKVELPTGVFEVIVIDPPWDYGTDSAEQYNPGHFMSRVASPYPSMTHDQLLELELPAADDCVLWLWTTHRHIWEAKELSVRWGFEYKGLLTWNKEKMGIGKWLRLQCEFCLLCVKGNPRPLMSLGSQRNIISEARREHSRKPEEFYRLVEEMNQVGRKLDYFSREVRPGWDSIGNTKEMFNEKHILGHT